MEIIVEIHSFAKEPKRKANRNSAAIRRRTFSSILANRNCEVNSINKSRTFVRKEAREIASLDNFICLAAGISRCKPTRND